MTQILDNARLHNAGILAKAYDISITAGDTIGSSAEQHNTAAQPAEASSGPPPTALDSDQEGLHGSAGRESDSGQQKATANHRSKSNDIQQGEFVSLLYSVMVREMLDYKDRQILH